MEETVLKAALTASKGMTTCPSWLAGCYAPAVTMSRSCSITAWSFAELPAPLAEGVVAAASRSRMPCKWVSASCSSAVAFSSRLWAST
eukprot:4629509-Lingulodinium_polyedra.AAC.1